MAHPNATILRELDDAMAAGDLETFFGKYTEDVKVHLRGGSKLAGDYEGIPQLQEVFGRFMEAAGQYTFQNHAYLADDEHGIILQRGTFTRGGQTFEVNEVFVLHFREGKVSEFWYLPEDQAAVDAWIG